MDNLQTFNHIKKKLLSEWKSFPDFYTKNKSIGKSKVTLIAGKKRGGIILVYVYHKDPNVRLVDRFHFANSSNARSDYLDITTRRELISFVEENL